MFHCVLVFLLVSSLQCSEFDLEFGTECLHLALQYCGTNARLIEGPPTLWKVTYKRDLAAAEAIIKETLSVSACIIAEAEEEAVELAKTLQKNLNMMETDVIPCGKESNVQYLSKTRNFIHISASASSSSWVLEMVKCFEDIDHARLYPVVIVWVQLSKTKQSADSQETDEFMALASEVKQRNVLLYGIKIDHSKELEQWQRSLERLGQITLVLIRDRNMALTGQMLHV